MFKSIKVRQNVNSISTNGQSICINTKQEELFLNDRNIDTTTSICGYFFSNVYFTFSNNIDFTNKVIDLNSNKIIELNKISLQIQMLQSKFIALEKINRTKNLIVYDLISSSKTILQQDISFGIKHLNKDNLIVNEGHYTLHSLSLLTGEYEWETDLENYGEIIKIFGVVNGYLWVWLNEERLIGIDIQTGAIYHNSYPLQSLKAEGKIDNVNIPQYIEEEQSIYFFYQNSFIQINLQTIETKILWQGEANFGVSFFTQDYIYFTAGKGKDFFRDSIGVFDRKQNKIVWQTQVIELSKNTYNNLQDIQATDDKIYVLDTEGTLHIFEKEKEA